MQRIVGATTMTAEIVELPKKLVYVLGDLVSNSTRLLTTWILTESDVRSVDIPV